MDVREICKAIYDVGYAEGKNGFDSEETVVAQATARFNFLIKQAVDEQIKKDAEICFEQGEEWDSDAQITEKNYATYSGNLIALQLKDGE